MRQLNRHAAAARMRRARARLALLAALAWITPTVTAQTQTPSPTPSSATWLSIPGCVAWYPFDGNFSDTSGASAHLAAVGAAPGFVAGPLGGSRGVRIEAASGGYLSTGALATLPSGSAPRTISFWMRIEQAGAGYPYGNDGTILGWGFDWTTRSSTVWYSHQPDKGGMSFSFSSYNNDLWTDDPRGPRYAPTPFSWQHYVVRFDGGTGVQFYVNGTLLIAGSLAQPPRTDANTALTVGWRGWCCGNAPFRFTGALAALGVFNRALMADEIAQLAAGATPLTPALLSASLTATVTATRPPPAITSAAESSSVTPSGTPLVSRTSSATASGSPPATVCGTAAEGASLTLTCPGSAAIESITFASYGTPAGVCGGFATAASHAATSLAVVRAACVGARACTVDAVNALFGDPCGGTPKRLHVQAVCARASPTATSTGSASATATATASLSLWSTPSLSPSRSPSLTRSGAPSASVTRSPVAVALPPGATRQLAGRYIRIGVNSRGTLGSVGNTPPGIQVDYSGTGNFLDAYDFLTPGSPWEGWSVKFGAPGSSQIHENNNAGSLVAVAGALFIYSGLAYRNETWDNRAVWVGTAAEYTIHHDVRFNRDDDVISIVTDITASTLLPRAFFARFTDPDARVSPLDSSTTRNARGWGPIPPSNIVLSEALASGYTQGLMSPQQGGVGTGITSPWSNDPEQYFPGSPGRPEGDDAIGIGFSMGDVPAGRTVQLKYFYVFGTGLFKTDKSVSMEPARGSMLGGTLVVVTPGVTLNATSTLLCRWGAAAAGGDTSVAVPAAYTTNATATCAAPFSLRLGAATLWFSTTGGASWGYIGVFMYVAPDAGGLPPLFLRPGGADSGSADGGPLLWPSTTSGSPAAEPQVSLALSWLLSDSELFAVSAENLYFSLELYEIADPLGTAEAWLGAAGPRHQGAPLPPVTPALQAALAAAELAAHVAVLANATAVSTGAARLLGSLETAVLGFGMTFADRADGSEGADVTAYYAAPVPLNASLRSPLAVRPVFVRLTARDAARGGRPLHVRTSSLRWLLPGPPPPPAAASPAPRGVSASGTPTASSSAARPGAPAPVAFDAHTACAAWKALRRNPATWNPGLPQCPQTLAQLSRSQWVPLNECPGLNGSVATAEGAVDAWGVAPCWAHRGRVAFGEVDARSCFVSAAANVNFAAASCCYDAAGRLLRAGSGSASDARFAPSPARLSHVFADQLPRLVCCRLSGVREDCDGVVRATGGFSWRGAGGAVGDPHFVTLDGAQLSFNGVGDFVYVGVKAAPSVPTPRIASLPAAPGRPWGALPAGVSFLSMVRLMPLSLLYPAGSSSASAVRGWAAVTAAGEHVSVTVRGGQLQVHVNGTMLPLSTETSGFVDAFYASSTFTRTRGALTALARTARYGVGNGTAAAAAEAAARAALASGAFDSGAADVTFNVGNVTVVFNRAQRRVLVALPHVGVAVTVSQVHSNVSALDGALLLVSADVASTNFGLTFGLLGDYNGVAANDVRTHGEPPPLSTEAAVFDSVNAALKVAAPNAAFPEALPSLPSPFTPVFTAALPAPNAAGADGALLSACGIAATAGSSGALPFAQAACYLDGSVTGVADVGAATLRLVRELEAASAAARGPAPEFASPPTSLALMEGLTASVTLSASVPAFIPGGPPDAVLFRVLSSPGGACSVGESSGVLACGPLAISDAGLTPSANGSHATGGVVVVASTRVTGASTLHQLVVVVEAAPSRLASQSASLSGSSSATSSGAAASSGTSSATATSSSSGTAASSSSSSATATATATASSATSSSSTGSVTPPLPGSASRTSDVSASRTRTPTISETMATALTTPSATARNESLESLAVASTSGPTSAQTAGGAAGGVIAALAALAACIVYRRRGAARGAATKAAPSSPAARRSGASDAVVWQHNASLSKAALPQSALETRGGGGSPPASAVNPVLLAQFASTRRKQPMGLRTTTQRASFAPTTHASARLLDAGPSQPLPAAQLERSHRALAATASPSASTRQLLAERASLVASPSASTRQLLAEHSSLSARRFGAAAGASPVASARSLLSSRSLVVDRPAVAGLLQPAGAPVQLSRQSSRHLVGASPGASTRNLSSRNVDSLA